MIVDQFHDGTDYVFVLFFPFRPVQSGNNVGVILLPDDGGIVIDGVGLKLVAGFVRILLVDQLGGVVICGIGSSSLEQLSHFCFGCEIEIQLTPDDAKVTGVSIIIPN
jgi:hypothetical protein